MAYLNHAGTSWPKPAPVLRAMEHAAESSPHEWATSFAQAHARLAAFFGVDDLSRLLPTPGCTSALNVAIADHSWQSGDQILISGMEHHALVRPCLKLAETAGVEVVVAPRPTAGGVDLDFVEATLARGRVRLVAMSAASNVTGELLPTDQLIALAHAHGSMILIDAAQVAGWTELRCDAMEVDLLAFAGHKGPQAPWGIGGLYVSDRVIMRSPAATCDFPAEGDVAACALMPGYCDVGSVDRVALAGLRAACDWLQAPARADRLTLARRHIERLVMQVLPLPGARLHGPRDPQARMPTAAFTFENHPPANLGAVLARRGVTASAGIQCAPLTHQTLGTDLTGVLRFSAGPFTTDDDIDAAAAALNEVLR